MFRLSVLSFRDLGSQLSLSCVQALNIVHHRNYPRTEGGTGGILFVNSVDTSEDIPEQVQILAVELKLQKANQNSTVCIRTRGTLSRR